MEIPSKHNIFINGRLELVPKLKKTKSHALDKPPKLPRQKEKC